MSLTLDILPHRYTVCRLSPDASIDFGWFRSPGMVSITRTEEELSVVVPEDHTPPGARCELGFRALRVRGPLAFELTGILSALATALAEAGVSLFAVSTFDTDYLLVREEDLGRAVEGLTRAGHAVDIRDYCRRRRKSL